MPPPTTGRGRWARRRSRTSTAGRRAPPGCSPTRWPASWATTTRPAPRRTASGAARATGSTLRDAARGGRRRAGPGPRLGGDRVAVRPRRRPGRRDALLGDLLAAAVPAAAGPRRRPAARRPPGSVGRGDRRRPGRPRRPADAAVGAATGGLSAAHWFAPPSMLALPLELAAETVLTAAVEIVLLGELHELHGRAPRRRRARAGGGVPGRVVGAARRRPRGPHGRRRGPGCRGLPRAAPPARAPDGPQRPRPRPLLVGAALGAGATGRRPRRWPAGSATTCAGRCPERGSAARRARRPVRARGVSRGYCRRRGPAPSRPVPPRWRCRCG